MTATAKVLAPKAHMIRSKMNADMMLHEALAELVDNAFAQNKGDARNIWIDFDLRGRQPSRSVTILDDGLGVDEIDRVFQLGNTSSYEDVSDIGLYGVGATDAAIWMGDELEVHTIRDGLGHSHVVNWRDCVERSVWPAGYGGAGKLPTDTSIPKALRDQKHGTWLRIRGIRGHVNTRTHVPNLLAKLGRMFEPGIRSNRQIHIRWRTNNRDTGWESVVPFAPPGLRDIIVVSGAVKIDGTNYPYQGHVGVADKLPADNRGISFAFQHRVIEEGVRDCFGTYMPTNVYGVVNLAGVWKHHLSPHKTKVVGGRDDLVVAIYNQIEPLLMLVADRADEIRNIELACFLEGVIEAGFDYRSDPPDIFPQSHGETSRNGARQNTSTGRADYADEKDDARNADTGGRVIVRWQPATVLSGQLFMADIRHTDRYTALVSLNEDDEYLQEIKVSGDRRRLAVLVLSWVAHKLSTDRDALVAMTRFGRQLHTDRPPPADLYPEIVSRLVAGAETSGQL